MSFLRKTEKMKIRSPLEAKKNSIEKEINEKEDDITSRFRRSGLLTRLN